VDVVMEFVFGAAVLFVIGYAFVRQNR